MEERKLNFNARLLSARRFSAPTCAPNGVKGNKTEKAQFSRRHTMASDASDSNLEQVTEPVAVPFHWEQIPGRRKDGRGPEDKTLNETSFSPIIPPRKVSDVIKFSNEEKISDVCVLKKQPGVNSLRGSVSELERQKESRAQTLGTDLENDNVDDDEDAFSDALETLSPTDSCSMTCSVTGLSSYDGQVKKLSGTFSTDPHSRDFMMSRFLPAAKAMALEPNHYAPKKQPVAVEQHKPIPKVVSRDRTPPISRYESAIVLYGAQNPEEEESEEEYDNYETSGNIRNKACGLIPRLCFKNSLAILNPVPGMKVKTLTSKPSNRDMEKLSKTAYSRSQSPMVKKVCHSKDSINKQKPDTEVQSPRLLETKSKLTCGSNRFASDWKTVSRSASPFRRSGTISPYRNEARQSPFRSTTFLGIPTEVEVSNASGPGLNKKFISRSQELVSYRSSSTLRGSGPLSFTADNILYKDTVNRMQKLSSGSGFSNMKHRLGDSGSDVKTLLKRRELEGTATREDGSEDVKCVNVPTRYDELEDKVLRSGDVLSSVSDTKTLGSRVTTKEDPGPESEAFVRKSDAISENQNTSSDLIRKQISRGNSRILSSETPLPLQLPKTPSESWLWRTLPTVSAQNPVSRLYQSKCQDSKTSSAESKWETIVKSSYLHHDHVRYSEELFPHHQFKS